MSDMIRIKRKNYIEEKAKERFDNNIGNQLASFGIIGTDRLENQWRVKKHINHLTLTEDNYEINQILRKYQSNKNEIKGFSSKYLTQLSDLLAQKDKNFTKKRFEIYNRRIAKMKSQNNDNNEKNTLQSFHSLSNINAKLNRIFKSKKSDTFTMFCADRSEKILNKKKLKNIFSKTIETNASKSQKNLRDIIKNRKTFFLNRNKINKNILLTQFNSKEKEEDNSYEDNIKGKEEFFISGDKDKYKEYLKKEYNFFNSNNLNQIMFLKEKNKRKKLFKSIENDYKYMLGNKKCLYKNKLFHRIIRDKSDDSNNMKYQKSKSGKINISKKNNKNKFYEDCKKIYLNVRKKLF